MSLTPERQLKEWQAGRPQCPNTDSECCPDFSCCKAELLAPPDIRDAYIAATREERLGLVAAKANRGTRLSGYGNAIVPPLAAEFVSAYMAISDCR